MTTKSGRIAEWFIRKFIPELHPLIEDRAKLFLTMRAMAEKLNALKADNEKWRQRCFSAERVLNYEVRDAMRTAYERHNSEHGHSLHTL